MKTECQSKLIEKMSTIKIINTISKKSGEQD